MLKGCLGCLGLMVGVFVIFVVYTELIDVQEPVAARRFEAGVTLRAEPSERSDTAHVIKRAGLLLVGPEGPRGWARTYPYSSSHVYARSLRLGWVRTSDLAWHVAGLARFRSVASSPAPAPEAMRESARDDSSRIRLPTTGSWYRLKEETLVSSSADWWDDAHTIKYVPGGTRVQALAHVVSNDAGVPGWDLVRCRVSVPGYKIRGWVFCSDLR